MDRNQELKGKVAIVTGAGAAAGIGIVVARTLAEGGAQVVLTGRREQELNDLTDGLKKDGLDVACVLADMNEPDSIESIVKFTVDTYGKVNVLINNAALTGHPKDTDVEHQDPEVWDAIFKTNARGTMLMTKYAIPEMRKAGGGSIINISSGQSMAGDMQYTAYACTKGAINTLTKFVATQYADDHIRCNALILGLVHTGVGEKTMPEAVRNILLANKLSGRLGTGEDIAEFVRFLSSDNSSWITGQELGIDGGFFAHQPTTAPFKELMAKMAAAQNRA